MSIRHARSNEAMLKFVMEKRNSATLCLSSKPPRWMKKKKIDPICDFYSPWFNEKGEI